MQERIIEIIVYLVNEMRNNKPLGEIDVKVLEEGGYTQAEISSAFSWLFDKLAVSDQILPHVEHQVARSYRILHEVEKMVITPQAQGYLIQLRELGILNDGMLETVIDRAMVSGYTKIGLDETRIIVASLVFETDDQKKIGNRIISPSSDTIH
jgi:Smg protein